MRFTPKMKKGYRVSRVLSVFLSVMVILTCAVTPAWAVQSHAGAEGLVVHQIGHLLFAGGMIYLLFRLQRIQLKKYAWFEFKMFLWLIIAWNVLTFSAHALAESVDKTKFVFLNGELVAFTINDFADAWFYLSQLDHLLLVPSFVFLLLALRKWGGER